MTFLLGTRTEEIEDVRRELTTLGSAPIAHLMGLLGCVEPDDQHGPDCGKTLPVNLAKAAAEIVENQHLHPAL